MYSYIYIYIYIYIIPYLVGLEERLDASKVIVLSGQSWGSSSLGHTRAVRKAEGDDTGASRHEETIGVAAKMSICEYFFWGEVCACGGTLNVMYMCVCERVCVHAYERVCTPV